MPYKLNLSHEAADEIADFVSSFPMPWERREALTAIRTELSKLADDPQSASHISAPYPRPIHRFSFTIGDTTYHKQVAFSFHQNENTVNITAFGAVPY